MTKNVKEGDDIKSIANNHRHITLSIFYKYMKMILFIATPISGFFVFIFIWYHLSRLDRFDFITDFNFELTGFLIVAFPFIAFFLFLIFCLPSVILISAKKINPNLLRQKHVVWKSFGLSCFFVFLILLVINKELCMSCFLSIIAWILFLSFILSIFNKRTPTSKCCIIVGDTIFLFCSSFLVMLPFFMLFSDVSGGNCWWEWGIFGLYLFIFIFLIYLPAFIVFKIKFKKKSLASYIFGITILMFILLSTFTNFSLIMPKITLYATGMMDKEMHYYLLPQEDAIIFNELDQQSQNMEPSKDKRIYPAKQDDKPESLTLYPEDRVVCAFRLFDNGNRTLLCPKFVYDKKIDADKLNFSSPLNMFYHRRKSQAEKDFIESFQYCITIPNEKIQRIGNKLLTK